MWERIHNLNWHAQEYKEAVKQKKALDTGITLIPNELNLFVWRALLQVRTQLCLYFTKYGQHQEEPSIVPIQPLDEQRSGTSLELSELNQTLSSHSEIEDCHNYFRNTETVTTCVLDAGLGLF